ncbi:hypothetical protein M378DRAFT_14329 [Amanita muscaria Koide BX008]|uniref:Uncharacterized protein n=1 Tax=Amanita muscaria (strain Koide BX008) TaxID=946122 RepID=A0A0C2T143_AMAMK|nr:hypothetical protein M378DRAFT_14329 [Amanita muscaria Koide BX008]
MLFKVLSRHRSAKFKTWDGTQSTPVLDKADMAATFLKPIKAFDSVVKGLANFHPYAKVGLSVLSWAALGISEDIRQLGNNQYLDRIVYAEGAGLDTTKACLYGTREEILHETIDS